MVRIPTTTKVVMAASATPLPLGECLQAGCRWAYQEKDVGYRATTEARAHTQATGHRTRVENVTRRVYERVPK